MDGRGVRRQTCRSPHGDDLGSRSLPRAQVPEGTADRRHQRPLRIPQQGARRIHRVAQKAGRLRPSQTRSPGLCHRSGRQPRPACGLAGTPGRPGQPDRRRTIQVFDPLPRIPEQRPDRERPERQHPHDRRFEGEGDLRADLPEQGRRHLQQGLLRTARRYGHHGIPLLLRTVGLYAARIGGILGADHHHDPRRVRAVGRQAARAPGRGGHPPRRLQRQGGRGEDRRLAAALQRAGRETCLRDARFGLRDIGNCALGAPFRRLRTGLLRGCRKFGDPYQPRRARREQRPQRTDQFRTPAALRREAQLEPHDGRQDPAQAPACPGRTFAQPLVVLEPRAPRPVRRHRPGTLGRMRAQPDRFPRQTERGTHEGARTRRGLPRAARRRICAVPRLYERKTRPEDPHDFVFFDGIRPALVAQDLLGRPGHTRGRLPQGGLGQERPDGSRGPALPVRLLHAAPFGTGGAGGDLRGTEFL